MYDKKIREVYVQGDKLIRATRMAMWSASSREKRRRRLGQTAKPAYSTKEFLVLAQANALRGMLIELSNMLSAQIWDEWPCIQEVDDIFGSGTAEPVPSQEPQGRRIKRD